MPVVCRSLIVDLSVIWCSPSNPERHPPPPSPLHHTSLLLKLECWPCINTIITNPPQLLPLPMSPTADRRTSTSSPLTSLNVSASLLFSSFQRRRNWQSKRMLGSFWNASFVQSNHKVAYCPLGAPRMASVSGILVKI